MEFYLAPVGAGKTEFAQQRINDLKHEKPFAKVWALLATERQIVDFRRRLINSSDRRVYVNIEFYNFYSLYNKILLLAGESQRNLSDSARYGVIRRVLGELKQAGQLPLYGGIAETAGFIRIIADFIYEIKQSVIDHHRFTEATELLGDDPKIRELARIYAAYQEVLITNKLVDREGEGWLALEIITRRPDLARDVDLFIVDGYDQFNPLQAHIVARLGGQAARAVVTLTTVPGRENIIGRRFSRALDRLQNAYNATQAPAAKITYGQTHSPQSAEIELLAQRIFALNMTAHQQPTEAISFIEAPDAVQETAAILRQVKKLLLDNVRPDDILIAVRDWDTYSRHFATFSRTYKLPVLLKSGDPLLENPAILTLVNLLELHEKDFRRRDLLDILRSPYVDAEFLGADAINELDALSRTDMITGGCEAWLDALHAMNQKTISETFDDEDALTPYVLETSHAEKLADALKNFFDGVTPPEFATVAAYIRWLEDLIGDDIDDPDGEIPSEVTPNANAYSISMPQKIRQQADALTLQADIIERDIAALHEFKQALLSVITAENLLHAIGKTPNSEMTWAEFWKQIKTTLGARHVRLRDTSSVGRDGRVLITTVNDARGVPHKHVFIPCLSEAMFPAPVPEDPLLLDSERRHITAKTGIAFATTDERADEDGIFYELINLTSDSLTLTRPTLKDGSPLPQSHLWRAVKNVLPKAKHSEFKLGQVIPAMEIATPQEAAMSAADAHTKGADLTVAAWLSADHAEYWRRITQGRWIEANRLSSRAPYDQFSGRLQDEHSLARVRHLLGSQRVWSATQLNEYGTCGFRFYAGRLLHLEKLEEPEEGLDSRQLGTLYHEILEATYQRVMEQGKHIIDDHLGFALETLKEEADRLLPTAPRRLGFRSSPLWTQEKDAIYRRLEGFVRADFSEASPISKKFGATPRIPYQLEAPFDGDFTLRLDDRDEIRVRGKIDRIDQQGDQLIVMDYKTGSTRINTIEISEGRNFQMLVYLRAAQAMIETGMTDENAPKILAGGMFIHLNNLTSSGVMDFQADDALNILTDGERHLARYIEQGRAGDFAVHANKLEAGKCARYCDYYQFCRNAIISRRKSDTLK